MSTVGLPPHLSVPQALSAAPITASVTNLPPGLANLSAGMIVQGVVVNRDPKGHLLVRTANGTLSLSTTLPLPTGAAIALQVQTTGAQMQMVILSVNQQPLPQGPEQATTATVLPAEAAAGRTGGSTPSPGPAVTVSTGHVLTATVVRPPPSTPGPEVRAGTSGPAASQPPSSGGAQGPAPSANAAAGAGGAPAPAGTGSAPAPTAAGPGPTAPNPAATDASPAPGSRFAVRVAGLQPEGAPSDGTAPRGAIGGNGAPGRLITGTVTASGGNGPVQVQTPIGTLSLSTRAALPPGTTVILEQLGPIHAPSETGPPPIADRPGALLALAREWPALGEAVKTLKRIDAPLAQHVSESVVPRPGSGLAANILFLLSALRGGDVRSWLGEAPMQALETAGHKALATRLADDFNQLARLAADPGTGDWRAWLIPVQDGGAMQLVRFFVRRQPRKGGAGDEADAGTRFLVELDLSRLGPLQLDGLVKAKRFDLMVRSHEALPDEMRRDIAAIFDDALAITGYQGGVTFQATPEFAVAPGAAADAHAVGLSV